MDWPPDRYEGRMVPPAGVANATPEASSTFDMIAAAIEVLYEREPVLLSR
jgi:hypothetical protein